MESRSRQRVFENRRGNITAHRDDAIGLLQFLQDRHRQFVRPIPIYGIRVQLEER